MANLYNIRNFVIHFTLKEYFILYESELISLKKSLSILLAVIIAFGAKSFVFALEPLDFYGHWAEQDIQLMMDEGVITDYGNFNPDVNITRADFATYISRLLPEPPADYAFEKGGFLDVVMGLPHNAEPPYYTIPIYYLHDLGIVLGDGEGFFHPQKDITREDIAVIIYRLLEVLEYNYPYAANGGLYIFADDKEITEYAYGAVFHLTRRSQLMQGYDREPQDEYGDAYASRVFRPKKDLTRAEAITIVARIFRELNEGVTATVTHMGFTDMYPSFIEHTESEQHDYILFSTNRKVFDFKYLAIECNEDAASYTLAPDGVLYELGELAPNKPLVVTWLEQGEVAHRGISFVDEKNRVRCYYLAKSGENGLPILVETEFMGEYVFVE